LSIAELMSRWLMAVVYCRADGVELVVTLQKLFKLLDEEVLLNPTTDNSGKSFFS
jgi:hypothetical protein